MKKKATPHKKRQVDTVVKKPDIQLPEWLPYAILGGITLFFFSIRLHFLSIPFERDEGAYSYFGQLLLDGKKPYLDFYEMKLPGIYYMYALLIGIFGHTVEGLHMGVDILNGLTLIMVFFICKELFNTISGLIAAASFGVLSMAPQISGYTTQSEHMVSFYMAASFLAAVYGLKRKSYLLLFTSGILAFISLSVKQNGIFFIAFNFCYIVLADFFGSGMKDWKGSFMKVLAYGSGVVLMTVLMFIFVKMLGVFDQFWYWTYTFPKLTYVSDITLQQGWDFFVQNFKGIYVNYKFWWYAAGIGLVISPFTKIKWPVIVTMWVLLFLSMLSIAPGLRFYGHYWLMLIPGLAICVGFAAYTSGLLIQKNISQTAAFATVGAVFFLAIVFNISSEKKYYFKPNYVKVLRETYGMNPFPEAKVIGDYIKAHSVAEDKIAVLGSEPQVYFYADRRCPSKHSYTTYLVNSGGIPKAAEMQKEFIADVEKAKPKFLVFFNHPISWLVHPKADRTIFSWFNTFISGKYKIVGVADMIATYQTEYIWGDAAVTYKPQGQTYVAIFERK